MRRNALIRVGLPGIVACFAALCTSHAAASTLNVNARAVDDMGTPLNGSFLVEFRIYDSEMGGSTLWMDDQVLDLDEGRFQTILGDPGNPIDTDVIEPPERWLGIVVDGGPEIRYPLSGSPFALRALVADDFAAGTLDGGLIQNGQLGLNELAACGEGEIIIMTAGGWACGSPGAR